MGILLNICESYTPEAVILVFANRCDEKIYFSNKIGAGIIDMDYSTIVLHEVQPNKTFDGTVIYKDLLEEGKNVYISVFDANAIDSFKDGRPLDNVNYQGYTLTLDDLSPDNKFYVTYSGE